MLGDVETAEITVASAVASLVNMHEDDAAVAMLRIR